MRFLIAAVLVSAAFFGCEGKAVADPLADLPDPSNPAAVTRFLVNNANWTSFAYISKKCGTGKDSCPSNFIFAMSDGDVGCGSGVPYFFATFHNPCVVELIENDPRGAIMVTLASTGICKERGWDPQDPRCAHATLSGKFVRVEEKDAEYAFGRKALLTRHPQFNYYPPGHKWFLSKLEITGISIISKFGGPIEVSPADYFKVKC